MERGRGVILSLSSPTSLPLSHTVRYSRGRAGGTAASGEVALGLSSSELDRDYSLQKYSKHC